MTILDRILTVKRDEVGAARRARPFDEVDAAAGAVRPVRAAGPVAADFGGVL